MATERDFYDILGVSKTATAAEIKSAYRKLALQWHPDRNKSKEAESKFKEINEAYEVLSDPSKKSKYDQFGHAAFGGGTGYNPFGQQNSGNPFSSYYTSGGSINFEDLFGGGAGGFSDPFDVFSSFFGGTSPFGGGRTHQAKPHYSIKLTFMEAAKGTEKTLVHQGKSHKVTVPAGTDDGTRIRYNDFEVSFDVGTHKEFKREGYDIITNKEISFTLAMLGGITTIPTLDGDMDIRVRALTQPETVIRLTGKGIKHLQSNKHGDLYIRYVIKFPARLSGKQKELLKKFEETT